MNDYIKSWAIYFIVWIISGITMTTSIENQCEKNGQFSSFGSSVVYECARADK